jgi:hypothetical protein
MEGGTAPVCCAVSDRLLLLEFAALVDAVPLRDDVATVALTFATAAAVAVFAFDVAATVAASGDVVAFAATEMFVAISADIAAYASTVASLVVFASAVTDDADASAAAANSAFRVVSA